MFSFQGLKLKLWTQRSISFFAICYTMVLMQQSPTACVSSVKENRNIKTYFLGSILSTASVLLTITTFQKCQMYKINIDAVWHWQYEIFFYTIKIDFLIRLKKISVFDFYPGLSEHLMGVWSSLNNKKQSISDKCKNQYILSTWFNGYFFAMLLRKGKKFQVLSVLKREST